MTAKLEKTDYKRIIKEKCFYDVIGDIHGYANELEELLLKLGYHKIYGVWQHDYRKAVFVGDFVDRGPSSRGVLSIVKGMVEGGFAHAVLGNHELNLILYLTKNPETGKPFKKPSESGRKYLEAIKNEFKGEPNALKEYLRWLRKLPFYLDFVKFRVVHAYWNSEYLQLIDDHRKGGKLSKTMLGLLSDPDHPFTAAVNGVSKGLEMKLPADLVIKDSNNIRRTNFRIKYWEEPADKTFYELSYGNKFKLPDYTVPKQLLFPFEVYDNSRPLLFIGHYCMGKENMIATKNICCIDACIASKGTLAAYKWNGETEINPEHFVFVNLKEN